MQADSEDEEYDNDAESVSADEYKDELDADGAERIPRALRTPKFDAMNILQVFEMLKDRSPHGFIDLQPSYQREEVWTNEQRCNLLDSITCNFYIPPIILSRSPEHEGEGRVTFRCIDGKQRLSTIRKFFEGHIPYVDPNTRKRYYWKSPPGPTARRKLLPDEDRKHFTTKSILYVEYNSLSDAQEREVFIRVQAGKSLNRAEKLVALVGPNSAWLSDTLKQKFSRASPFHPKYPNQDKRVPYNTSRAKPYEFLCFFAIFVEGWMDQQRTKQCPSSGHVGSQKRLAGWLTENPELPRDVKIRIHQVLDKLNEIGSSDDGAIRDCLHYYFPPVLDPTPPDQIVKEGISFSPVEMIFTAVLLHRHMDQPNVGLLELSEMIKGMRTELCSKHKKDRTLNDARANVCLRYIGRLEVPDPVKTEEDESEGEPDHPLSDLSSLPRTVSPEHTARNDQEWAPIPADATVPSLPTPLPTFLDNSAVGTPGRGQFPSSPTPRAPPSSAQHTSPYKSPNRQLERQPPYPLPRPNLNRDSVHGKNRLEKSSPIGRTLKRKRDEQFSSPPQQRTVPTPSLSKEQPRGYHNGTPSSNMSKSSVHPTKERKRPPATIRQPQYQNLPREKSDDEIEILGISGQDATGPSGSNSVKQQVVPMAIDEDMNEVSQLALPTERTPDDGLMSMEQGGSFPRQEAPSESVHYTHKVGPPRQKKNKHRHPEDDRSTHTDGSGTFASQGIFTDEKD